MNKTKSIYFFAMIFGMFAMIAAMTIVLITLEVSVPLVLLMSALILMLMIIVAVKLSSGTFELQESAMVPCEYCGENIAYNSTYCKHCGVYRNASVECEYCSTINNHENDNCTNCNASLK